MDSSKVDSYMKQFAAIEAAGNRLGPNQRESRRKVREAKMLDRVDCDVLVFPPVALDGPGEPTWEHYMGLDDYKLEDGALILCLTGVDADGDPCTGRVIVYPEGRWLKFTTNLESVPNPYYADPDGPDPDSEAPRGFGE